MSSRRIFRHAMVASRASIGLLVDSSVTMRQENCTEQRSPVVLGWGTRDAGRLDV
jgi:hypothetical protein